MYARRLFLYGVFILISCFSITASASIVLTSSVSGLPSIPQQNTSARLNEAIQELPNPLDETEAENFYNYSDSTVYAGVAPFGYFQPDIQKNLQKDASHWQAQYQVDPGPQTRVIKIHLQLMGAGAHEANLLQLLNQAPLAVGNIFLSDPYEKFKAQLLTTANTLGYVKANFTQHQVLIDRKKNTAVINLTLDTGPRFYFGALHFSPTPFHDSFLDRYVPFHTGAPYNGALTSALQANLTDSNYFNSVIVTPDLDHADENNQVPLQVQLKPRPKQQYILGAGFGTDTGPRATLGSDWRYLNGYGHRLNTLLRLSAVQDTAIVKYTIPGKQPLTDEYNFNASLQTNDINQGNSQVKQVGAGYTLLRGQWQRTFSLSYQIETWNFFNNPYQISHLLLPGFSLQKRVVNDALFPTEGHRISFNIISAKEDLGSDTSLIQAKYSAKWLHSFSDRNMILLRTDLGYTAIHNTDMLPLSLNFFSGGSQSVRGYSFNALGPGRYLIVGSAEYRYRVLPKWYTATFFDMGNAFQNFPEAPHPGFRSQVGAFYKMLQQGAGLGVVWNSPVGAMELTLAQEVNVPGKPKRIQFNMGTDL